jgi:hypothetical protein
MKKELWRCIPEFDGYIVSNLGRVMSLPSTKSKLPGRVLSARKQFGGYYQVGMTIDGNKTYQYVHRLVAMGFLKRKPNYTIVMHLDDDPSNNILSNLIWGTHYQNSAMISNRIVRTTRIKMKDLIISVMNLIENNKNSYKGSKKELIGEIAADLGYTHAYIASIVYHHSKK